LQHPERPIYQASAVPYRRRDGRLEFCVITSSGGTLLNMKFTPALLADEQSRTMLGHLIRSYFKLDGHHVQFNVVRADTLREAQRDPDGHRSLIVRVAGYSDYFCELPLELQNEIIARTEHATL